MIMLQVIELACSRNETVLFKNLSFSLMPGQGLQLQAANGIGKSTLLKTIAKILPISVGKVKLSCTLLYCGHNNNLHPSLTPKQNLSYILSLRHKTRMQQICDALIVVGLQDFIDVPCSLLSAGQLQRIVLAQLVLSKEVLWLLDEPMNNLDVAAQELLQNLCLQHLNGAGMLMIATHNQLNFCNHKIYLEQYA